MERLRGVRNCVRAAVPRWTLNIRPASPATAERGLSPAHATGPRNNTATCTPARPTKRLLIGQRRPHTEQRPAAISSFEAFDSSKVISSGQRVALGP